MVQLQELPFPEQQVTQYLKETPFLAQDEEAWGWLQIASKSTASLEWERTSSIMQCPASDLLKGPLEGRVR